MVRSSFSGFNKESSSTPELVMLWGCRYFIANLCHFMGNWMTSQNKNAEKSLSAIVVCMFSPIHTWTTWNYGSEDNSFNFWVVQNFGFVKIIFFSGSIFWATLFKTYFKSYKPIFIKQSRRVLLAHSLRKTSASRL